MPSLSIKVILLTYLCAFVPFLQVLAEGPERPDYDQSPVDDCLKALGDDFTYEAAQACFAKAPGQAKRTVEMGSYLPRRAAADIFRRQEQFEYTRNCVSNKVPGVYAPADQVRALADEACHALDDKIQTSGAGRFYRDITNAFQKKGPTIEHGRNLLVAVSLAMNTKALKLAVQTSGTLFDYCKKILQDQATKGVGCTGQQSGFQKGKNSETTGGITGTLYMKIGGKDVGNLQLSYLDPGTTMA